MALDPPLTMTIDCPCFGIFGAVTVISKWIITALWSCNDFMSTRIFCYISLSMRIITISAGNTVYYTYYVPIPPVCWSLMSCYSYDVLHGEAFLQNSLRFTNKRLLFCLWCPSQQCRHPTSPSSFRSCGRRPLVTLQHISLPIQVTAIYEYMYIAVNS